METLKYCLNCLLEVENHEWELVLVLDDQVVFRCPRCKTIHNCYSNGTISIKKMEE
jgi:hypothetical protein